MYNTKMYVYTYVCIIHVNVQHKDVCIYVRMHNTCKCTTQRCMYIRTIIHVNVQHKDVCICTSDLVVDIRELQHLKIYSIKNIIYTHTIVTYTHGKKILFYRVHT